MGAFVAILYDLVGSTVCFDIYTTYRYTNHWDRYSVYRGAKKENTLGN